tara:strand:- start:18 stop:164 length:147 start_codon:yes stop_codon:yes gene_type:complete
LSRSVKAKVVFTIALFVKEKFENSYKNINDNDVKKVEEYIVFLKNNPN